jgi:hypothetical protein
VLSTLPALAQWTTQTIPLRPGWNAVFLEVQPEPRECDAIFAGLPVESAWAWNKRFNTVEYIQDPATLTPQRPDWLKYLPANHPMASAVNLFSLEGGKTYLIKLPDNASATNWVVRGRPSVRTHEWLSDSFNLFGFPVDRSTPPTFQTFFTGATGLSNSPVYRLSTSGYWTNLATLATARLTNSEAYWIRCNGVSEYQGPLTVTLAQRGGLDYGRILQEQTVIIRNTSRTNRSITVRLLASDPAPAGQLPVAGGVPLDYWDRNLTWTDGGWKNLPTSITLTNLAPDAEWPLRLAVRRDAMPRLGLCQSLLEISDSPSSLRLLVPVSAEGLQGATTSAGAWANGRSPKSDGDPNSRSGLWVGSVVLTNVSRPASPTPGAVEPTASEFQFRLLVHVNGAGQAVLLQKVLQMWQNGTYTNGPSAVDPNQTVRIMDTPGRFVLVSDDALIPRFTGAALRDGQPVARRFSTVAFALRTPQPCSGTGQFGDGGSVFSSQVVLPYNDPVNPFYHRFHPDHDNLNERFEVNQPLPEGLESFTITRRISLNFTATDPQALRQPGWGDSQVGGYYQEIITGLHSTNLITGGVFRLHRACSVPVLNDGL